MQNAIEIYQDPETDEFTVSCDDYDDYCTFDEQEAIDEAQARADETGFEINWW